MTYPSPTPTSTPTPPTHAVLNFLAFLAVAARFRYRALPHAAAEVELVTGGTYRAGSGLGPALSRRIGTDLRAGQLRPATLHRELTAGRLSGRSSLVLRRAVEGAGLSAEHGSLSMAVSSSCRQPSMLQTAVV